MNDVSTLESFLAVNGIQNFKSDKDFELLEDLYLEVYEWDQYYYLDCWVRKYTHDSEFKFQIIDKDDTPGFLSDKFDYETSTLEEINKELENITPIQQLYLRINKWLEDFSRPEFVINSESNTKYSFNTKTIGKLIEGYSDFQKVFQHLNLEYPTKDTLDKLKNQVLKQEQIIQGKDLIEDLGYEYMGNDKFKPFGSFIAQLQDVSYSENFEQLDYMIETSREVCFNGFSVNLSFHGDDEGSGNKYITIYSPNGKSSCVNHTKATPEYIQDVKTIMKYFKLNVSLLHDFNELFLEMIGAKDVAEDYLSKESLEWKFKIN